MNIPKQAQSVPDLVAAASGELTRVERRIAEAILAEPTLPAFGSVSDLATQVGTSRPSIVRFAQKLGFEGYPELQSHARESLTQGLSRPSERIRSEDRRIAETRTSFDDAISSVFEAIDGERLALLAAPLAEAERVWVLSGETSKAGARAFTSRLSILRDGVRLLEEESPEAELSSAGPNDAAIVFDFFRYRRPVITAAEIIARSKARLIAVTDSPLSPLVKLADRWCTLRIPAIGPFDSSVPVVMLAELLVSHVAKELHDDAKERIDRIEALWDTTGRFA